MPHATRRKGDDPDHHHAIDLIADANALVSGLALYPQLIKVVATHHVNDLSVVTFYIVFFTNITWFAYGIHRRALPVLLTSVMNLGASGILIALVYMFRG